MGVKMRLFSIVLSALSFALITFIEARDALAQFQQPPPPPTLRTLQTIEPEMTLEELSDEENNQSIVRNQGQLEAALSYGARGGLAFRTFQIAQELRGKDVFLDKTFDFKQLLITAPSGLLIEPPIIAEADDVLLIENDGQEAAVADKLLNIGREARIVSAARDWREYLIREWGEVDPPPDLLLPQNSEEREAFEEAVEEGFIEGVRQADEIFQADLNLLVADFLGMVRYRMLLAQGIVSKPFALQVDRGITGGGSELRVGDRALKITGPSEFKPGAIEWQPASR